MIDVKVDSSNLRTLRLALDDLGENWQQVAKSTISETLQLGERVSKQAAPVGVTSHLRNSIATETGVKGAGERITFTGELFSDLSYAGPANDGRRPGSMPPYEALIRWVQVKLGVSKKESRSVAFLVARKIGKKGTKGHRFFDAALKKMAEVMPRIAERHVERVIRRFENGLP